MKYERKDPEDGGGLVRRRFLIAPVRAAEPSIRAQSAILMDAESGRVLYELDADTRSRIASTTKIMTGLLACETLALDAEYAVPAEAVGIEGSSMYLRAGERVTGRELLYGLMLRSGNDAAVALAILCDGSVERFAARMNARAAKLGMENTHFQNPNGLDEEGHFSTARDLARLARAAMKNPDFREAAGTKNASFGQRALTNHNKLLWSYPGANGVKTGYTRAAGRILVSSAERGGRLLIAVTICDPDDWNDHAKLLDYGFSAFEKHTFLSAGEAVGTVPVVGGTEGKRERRFRRDAFVAAPAGGTDGAAGASSASDVRAGFARPGGVGGAACGWRSRSQRAAVLPADDRAHTGKEIFCKTIWGIRWKNGYRRSCRATESPPAVRRRS